MGRIFFRFGKTTPDEWDSIEKALSHKYIKRIPTGKPDRPWYYIYAETFLKPFKALAEIFGISERRVGDDFEKENIKKEYGVDKKTFAAHILEYFTNKEKWNKIFGAKENREKYKKPVKQSELAEAITRQTGQKPSEKKRIINRSLMKKVWSLYSPQGKQNLQAETQDEAQARESRSQAMLGNQNAKKDGVSMKNDGQGASKGGGGDGGDEPPKKVKISKSELENLLKKAATPMPKGVEFTRENFDKYFANGVDTPIGKVKVGKHQFQKLEEKDRKDLIAPMYETLKNPCIIGESENGAKLYVKSFLNENNRQRNIVSVVVDKGGIHISISTHEERVGQIAKKISGILYQNSAYNGEGRNGDSPHHGTVRNESVADTSNISQPAENVNEKLDGNVNIGGATQDKSGNHVANDSITQQVAESSSVSFNPNDENYAYKDTGYIAGSQKEKIAAFWATKAAVGDGVTVEEIDWNALEETPRYAEKQIVKKNIMRKVDYEALQKSGMSGGVGFLYDKIMNSVATVPKESTVEARKNYVIAINTLQSRLEECKNVDQIKNALSEINSEIKGEFMGIKELPEYLEYSNRIANLKETIRKEREAKIDAGVALENALKDEKMSSLFKGFLGDFKHNSPLKGAKGASQGSKKSRDDFWEIMALESKAWYDFMDSNKEEFSENADFKKYLELTKDYKRSVLENWYGETVYLESPAEIESKQIRNALNEFVQSVQDEYKRSNPICEAWKQLGDGFENCALTASELKNWSRSKRFSKTFEKHIWNANNGKFDDWNWLPKEKENSASGDRKQRKGAFQLLVAKEHERVGGRNVSVRSTSDLKKMFNLRDIQSGTWVLDDPSSAKWHIDRCCESFADLCDVTGIPESLVSLNGRLALAIGARGHGGALAHYEPVERVINITKMKGGGSLAHEWFHSFDNLLSEAISGGNYNAWYTNDGYRGAKKASDEIPEVKEAFSKLVKAMREGNVPLFDTVSVSKSDKENWQRTLRRLYYVSQTRELYNQIAAEPNYEKAMKLVQDNKSLFYDENDTESHKEFGIKKFVSVQKSIAAKFGMEEAKIDTGKTTSQYYQDALTLDGGREKYWSSAHEMAARAFSGFVGDSLRKKGRKNTYLSSHDRNSDYEKQGFRSKPNPEGKERERINDAFKELFDMIKATGAIRKAIEWADIEMLVKNFSTESKVRTVKKSWCYFKKDGFGNMRFYIKKSVVASLR